MTGVEHFATVAHRLIDQLRPKETDMASTETNAASATVTFDGGVHWLECDQCKHPICQVNAGKTLSELLAWHLRHRHAA